MTITIALPLETTNDVETPDLMIERSESTNPLAGSTDSPEAEQNEEMMNRCEPCWDELYPPLQSLARYLVNTLPLVYWYGREADVAADIVQETMRRLLERIQKARRGEAPPVKQVKQMMTTIAFNYYRDLKRHERRLLRLEQYTPGTSRFSEGESTSHLSGQLSEQFLDFDSIAEKVDQEALFDQLAKKIECFPKKQRRALLIDLANRMYFDDQPTALQAAFLDAGIEMRDYQQPLPTDQRARNQHISLLSQAYKRIARLNDLTEMEDEE